MDDGVGRLFGARDAVSLPTRVDQAAITPGRASGAELGWTETTRQLSSGRRGGPATVRFESSSADGILKR